ncbi:hypothetical protein F8M41_016960 [Gigaspora margarita]|uniref:Uncharacterized protein n=1 Tax=Gigaspora margarita TaxID=4874 RepID=A0A8H4ANN3_GIGMA|nr:hypothetical protein F8M41_016960 [Gigaspora margarita]
MIRRILSLERNFQSVKESSREKNLPIQIGWNLSVKKINTFFEHQDTCGYKFEINPKGNVFIVEMEKAVHASVVTLLQDYFKFPNGGVIINSLIDVLGSSVAHYQPNGEGKLPAPRYCYKYSGLTIILMPLIPDPPPQRKLSFRSPRLSRYLEISAVDTLGRPHTRIICEIAVLQNYRDWNAKCSHWMQQQYARLWTHQVAPVPRRYTAIAGQVGVYYEEIRLACY